MPAQEYSELSPGPDLYPLYPTAQGVDGVLNSLTIDQRHTLAAHALSRAILFADIALLTYLLRTKRTRVLMDLSIKDEDGLGLVSQAILGFSQDIERDIEREECIRLLISEGADMLEGDLCRWTPLHFAALHAPPTLIAHLLAHRASPLATSHKGLTPLDIITAYEALPHRRDVATLLEEAMRERGWYGNDRERRRERKRIRARMEQQKANRRIEEWSLIGRALELKERWWGEDDIDDIDGADSDHSSDSEEDEDSEDEEPIPFTPPRLFNSMLVFALPNLPSLLHSLIEQAEPVVRPLASRSSPANGLYYLTRFACICCDPTWVEEVIVSALDKIQDAVRARHEDLPHLAFWLFNTTLFLHLLSCDNDVNAIPDIVELFELTEEVVNSIYVFIIRVVEMRIDPLIDPALLEYSPLASEFESVQFESEWSFFRSLTTPKRKAGPSSPPQSKTSTPGGGKRSSISQAVSSGNINRQFQEARPSSPVPSLSEKSSGPFASLRFRSGTSSSATSLVREPAHTPNIPSNTPTPSTVTSIMTALHTLLSLYGINPTLIIQVHSQILYWTGCELFNRLISRKKYLCRSRAIQIGMNVGLMEEWVAQIGLPKGVTSHFAGVRQLLTWLQCLSSITDFPHLIDTIQTMKALNPLQMRRAMKDYRYEVSEGRMTEECSQYLAQMQKDWERQRIKLGVELARKEREREREGGTPSSGSDEALNGDEESHTSDSKMREQDEAQRMIDNLFDYERPKSEWMPPKLPETLGELMNSKYMIPLIFPSDPAMLCACPGLEALHPPFAFTAGMDSHISAMPLPSSSSYNKQARPTSTSLAVLRGEGGGDHHRSHSRAESQASHSSHASMSSMGSISRGPMRWRNRGKKLREVDVGLLDLVGGATEAVWDVFGVRFMSTDMQINEIGQPHAECGVEEVDARGEGYDDVVHAATSRRPSDLFVATTSFEELSPTDGANLDDITPSARKINDRANPNYAPSISSSRSSHSVHLTANPIRPTTASEKRKSFRLARRSSGGETAMPHMYEAETPTMEGGASFA
ncbi:hypothetical protein FRB96_004891 [Tulasnella sp. 330]|nr:hypothetical protein FRB96_004891 [Tulasnella sp. 330]